MEKRLPNVPVLKLREYEKPIMTEEQKEAHNAYDKRWKEYKPARMEQFRIKEDKARHESKLNTEFAKKLRNIYNENTD